MLLDFRFESTGFVCTAHVPVVHVLIALAFFPDLFVITITDKNIEFMLT